MNATYPILVVVTPSIPNTAQILTHVREKLQFVEKENESLSSQLEQLDQALVEKRDHLGKIKASRDAYRQKGRKIKQASVYITNPGLLDDIDVRPGGLFFVCFDDILL